MCSFDLLERWIFKSRSSNCLGTDLDGRTELSLQAIFAVDCNTAPFGSSILSENVVVRDEHFRIFDGLPKPGFRHS